MDRTADIAATSWEAVAAPLAAALLDACPDPAIVVGPDWHPLAWNRNFLDLWQIGPGGGARSVWRQMRKLLLDHRAGLAAWRRAAGGTFCATLALAGERWVEIRASVPASLGGTKVRFWFCRDVTEATLRERELRADLERTRLVVDHFPDAVYLCSVGGDGQFHPEMMNAAAWGVSAVFERRRRGRPLEDALPPWLAPVVMAAHRRCRDTAQPVQYQRVAPPDEGGSVRDCVVIPLCDQTGAVVRTLLVSRDATDRQRERQDLADAAARAEAAERRAEQAQARLVEVIETLPAAFMLFDRDENLVLANSQCRESFPLAADQLRKPGGTLESLLRANLAAEVPDAGPDEIKSFLAQRLAEFRAATGSTERPLADGRWILASDRRTPSGDTVSLRIDVTRGRVRERALAEAALAWTEREAQLRRIYANIPGVVYQLRVGVDREFRFEYISDRVVEIFGVTPAEALQDSGLVFGACHLDDKRRLAETMAAAHRALAPWDCEFRIAVGDGIRWLRGSALPTATGDGAVLWDGVFVDITATKAAEADALGARRRLEDAVESLSEGFALYDAGGQLLLSNSRQREIQAAIDPGFVFAPGVSFEAAMRSSIAASRLDDPDSFISRRLEDFRLGNGAWEVQLANGQWFQGTERRMRDGGVVAMRRDITLLKRREEQLRTAMIEAMTANKAKSEFLANMSHELRTPLNAIIGFSEMIESEIFGPLGNPRYSGYVSDIHASGQHLLNIINTVLDLARVEAGKIVLTEGVVDIDGLISECASLMRERLVRGKLRLELEIAPGLPTLRADPVRLKQVVLNLLSNAIKFTEPQGDITIRADRNHEGALVLEIADTGIGMDPRNIPQAFEPFGLANATQSRAYEGTGLGLPLSKALVEEHGGQLVLTSALGIGTIARVTLPAARFIPPVAIRGAVSRS